MDARIYTNRGEEVPLGVESALPYLDAVAEVVLQRAGRREHAGMLSCILLRTADSAPPPNGDGMQRTNPILYLVKGERHGATFEGLHPVHS